VIHITFLGSLKMIKIFGLKNKPIKKNSKNQRAGRRKE
jgi:hypothetical protein